MKLVIGGAYQGKREFLMQKWNLCEGEIADMETCMRPDQLSFAADSVPVDRKERDFREACGRTLCLAAQLSDEVWRVICGIGERIK